jgi:hypothetical protein
MAEYVIVEKSELTAVADAIRMHSGTDKLYKLAELPMVIKKLFVLPSGEVISTISNCNFKNSCIGTLPTIYTATATSIINGMSFTNSVEGCLVDETEMANED